jgi:hypothetical protein
MKKISTDDQIDVAMIIIVWIGIIAFFINILF